MLADGERDTIRYWLGKKIEPTAEFWEKAEKHGFIETYYAIRKAAQEEKSTIEHITNLIGNVVKESGVLMYKQGVDRSCL